MGRKQWRGSVASSIEPPPSQSFSLSLSLYAEEDREKKKRDGEMVVVPSRRVDPKAAMWLGYYIRA
jgi:hypothetical protein